MGTTAIIAQIIVFLVIVGLFAITIKNDKTKITSKEMTMIALLCVVSAVLARVLAIKIPPGQPIFIISLALSVTTAIGLLVSPKLALIAGIIIDILGLLMSYATGDGSLPFLGFTLSSMLGVYIPSVMIRKLKYTSVKRINLYIYGFLIILVGLGFAYIFSADSISIDGAKNALDSSMKALLISLLILISIVVIVVNYYFSKKIDTSKSRLFVTPAHLTLILIVCDVINSVILTSLWLAIMYGLPFDVAAATRIVKSILQLPINIFLVYMLLKYLPMNYKTALLKEK